MASIEINFAGIIALLYERDQNGNPITCVLGVVEGVPEHKLTIECEKDGTTIPIDAQVAKLQLEVDGTTTNGVRFFRPQLLDRIAGLEAGTADPESFSWILDLENELFNKEIGVDPSRFRTVFRINNCEVFTKRVSDNHLLCNSEENPHESPTLIGKVATIVGLRTELDTPGSVARLLDDGNPVVEVNPGEKLKMTVRFECDDQHDNGLRPGHANHYYRALGNKLVYGEKELFSSTRMPPAAVGGTPATPDASCLIVGGGKSNPNG